MSKLVVLWSAPNYPLQCLRLYEYPVYATVRRKLPPIPKCRWNRTVILQHANSPPYSKPPCDIARMSQVRFRGAHTEWAPCDGFGWVKFWRILWFVGTLLNIRLCSGVIYYWKTGSDGRWRNQWKIPLKNMSMFANNWFVAYLLSYSACSVNSHPSSSTLSRLVLNFIVQSLNLNESQWMPPS